MKGLVISVLALGAAVALLAPQAEQRPTPVVAEAIETQPAETAHSAWYGSEMVLARAGDGHYYADVRIDTRDYRMMVDTGASVVALTGEDARDIGLDWNPNDLAPVVRGAGGPVLGVPVTLDEVAVGDFEAHDVEAVIIPDGLPVSLLGQSYLSRVGKVEISGDELKLAN